MSIDKNTYICVVGGANIDIVGFSNQQLIFRDANQGKLKISMGGVGRNIAENLVRLGLNTKLICVLGDDIYGEKVVESSRNIGIDIQDSLFVKERQSSVYLAIMDMENDLALGLSAMDICNAMDSTFIQKKKKILQDAKLVVLDTNISQEVLVWIVKNIPEQQFFLDTVSVSKAIKSKPLLKYLHTIKTNVLEAEALTGMEIKSINDLENASDFFHKKGIQHVFITQGKKGIFYSDVNISNSLKPFPVDVVNTNGAGDAFVAGIVYAHLQNKDIKMAARLGLACSAIAVQHEDTVNSKITEGSILKMIK